MNPLYVELLHGGVGNLIKLDPRLVENMIRNDGFLSFQDYLEEE